MRLAYRSSTKRCDHCDVPSVTLRQSRRGGLRSRGATRARLSGKLAANGTIPILHIGKRVPLSVKPQDDHDVPGSERGRPRGPQPVMTDR
jgi:hypothetical protein